MNKTTDEEITSMSDQELNLYLKRICFNFFCNAVAAYIFSFFILVLTGIVGGLNKDDHCYTPTSRIGYVMPGFKIGCWLGQRPND